MKPLKGLKVIATFNRFITLLNEIDLIQRTKMKIKALQAMITAHHKLHSTISSQCVHLEVEMGEGTRCQNDGQKEV